MLVIPVLKTIPVSDFIPVFLIPFISLLVLSLFIVVLVLKNKGSVTKLSISFLLILISFVLSFFTANNYFKNCDCIVIVMDGLSFRPGGVMGIKGPVLTLPVPKYVKGFIHIVFTKNADFETVQNEFNALGLNLPQFVLKSEAVYFQIPSGLDESLVRQRLEHDPLVKPGSIFFNMYIGDKYADLKLNGFYSQKFIKNWENTNYSDLMDPFIDKADADGIKYGNFTLGDPWESHLVTDINVSTGQENRIIGILKKFEYIKDASRIKSGWLEF